MFYSQSLISHHRYSERETHEGVVRLCTHLMEEWTVCDRKSESVEAHSQHHVVRSVITVALTAAVKKSDHSLPAEHHAAATHTHKTQNRCTTQSI